MVLPKELLGNVDIFVEDEDRQLLERAAQGLPSVSGRLAEPELQAELILFLRMHYKNKSQHQSTTYFRTITHVKTLATRLQQLEAASIVQELVSLIASPQAPGRSRLGVVSSSSGSWSLPSRQAIAFALGRIRASIDLCRELCDVILACSRSLSVLLAQAYFLPLATVATSSLARMYVLYCAQGDALTDAYNHVAAVASLFPVSLASDDRTSSIFGWDRSVRQVTADLPATLTWSVSPGKPPSLTADGRLALWPADAPTSVETLLGTASAAEGAPRTLEGLVSAGAKSRAATAGKLTDLLPESAVERQQLKKGLKKKKHPTAEEVRDESLHKMIIIEDRGQPVRKKKTTEEVGGDLAVPRASVGPATRPTPVIADLLAGTGLEIAAPQGGMERADKRAPKKESQGEAQAQGQKSQKAAMMAMISVGEPQGFKKGSASAASATHVAAALLPEKKTGPSETGAKKPGNKPPAAAAGGPRPGGAGRPGSLASIFDSLLGDM